MHRIFVASFAAFALLFAAGCPKSPEGGKTDKTQTKTDTAKPVTTDGKTPPANTVDNKDQTFKITEILTNVDVKQGGANQANIELTRSNNFTQSVKLEAKNVPAKLKVDITPGTLKAGDRGPAVLKVQAEKDAPLGKHTIRVEGIPDMGNTTGINVDIKVNEP